MPNTLEDVEAFGPAHPHPHQGGTWNQRCEQFINNSGGFTQGFDTAELAGDASGDMDPDWTTALPGEIHYWSGAGDGHDAWQTEKGLLCASNIFAAFWGYIDFETFEEKKPAFKYRGHTFRHGTQTLADLSLSSTGTVTPITDPTLEEKMDLIHVVAVAASGSNPGNPEIYELVTDFTHRSTMVSGATHAEASAVSAFTGQPSKVMTLAQLVAIRATIDKNAALLPSSSGSSNTAVLDAIAALSTLETADEKAILAQLSALPDSVRKNIVAALGS